MKTTFYPSQATLLADGTLRVPTAGIAEDGERWDGVAHIDRDDPRNSSWLQEMWAYARFEDDTRVETMALVDGTRQVRLTYVPTDTSVEMECPQAAPLERWSADCALRLRRKSSPPGKRGAESAVARLSALEPIRTGVSRAANQGDLETTIRRLEILVCIRRRRPVVSGYGLYPETTVCRLEILVCICRRRPVVSGYGLYPETTVRRLEILVCIWQRRPVISGYGLYPQTIVRRLEILVCICRRRPVVSGYGLYPETTDDYPEIRTVSLGKGPGRGAGVGLPAINRRAAS